ncbi:hypothetical protein GCM10020331_082300 [Ectobacillus funiculus]
MQDTVTQQQPIKKEKWVRFLTIFMVSILLLLTVAYAGGTLYIKKEACPLLRGKISLRGLQDSVTVTRDQQGVPHIEAKKTCTIYMCHKGM